MGQDTSTAAAPTIRCYLTDHVDADAATHVDAFVTASPYPSQLQRPSWVELAPTSRLQRFVYLRCEADGELVLTALVRLTCVFPGRYLAVMQRGPIFRDVADLDAALPAVMRTLREAGACTLLMNPRWEDAGAEEVKTVLRAHGGTPLPRGRSPMHSATGLVDLTRAEDDILAGFHKRGRKDIARAVRRGLVVRRVETEEDAHRLRALRVAMSERKGLEDGGQADLVAQWHALHSKKAEEGVGLVAEVEGEMVGGLVVGREGDRAIIRGGGSLPVRSRIPRLHNLYWEAMRHMKAQGCREFDVAGLPDPESNGEVSEDERNRAFFKMTFNPRSVRLVPVHVVALRPVSHALLFRARQWYRRSPVRRVVGPLLAR